AYVHLAHLLATNGARDEARQVYAKAIVRAHDLPTLLWITETMQRTDYFDESEQAVKRALTLSSNNPAALFSLGKIYEHRREYDTLISLMRKMIDTRTADLGSYSLLALTYLKIDKPALAEHVLDQATVIAFPNDRKRLAGLEGWEALGDFHMKKTGVDSAIRYYERALSLDPENTRLKTKLSEAGSRPVR
ncbi:MAG TPA: hypothetical protein VGC60_11810, partial [Pyrinomonadaceae bacterium]